MYIFYLEVFQLDLQVPFMMHVFLSQENSMAVVAGLPKNLDGNLNIKVDLTFTTLLKNSAGRQWCYSIMWQPLVTCSLRKNHLFFDGNHRAFLLLSLILLTSPFTFSFVLISKTFILSAHFYRISHLNELFQLRAVLQLGVTVQ